MAILYSYPQASPGLNDLVLGSQYVEGEGMIAKSFTVGEIGQLITSTYSTVQSLTTSGGSGSATLIDGVLNIPNYTVPYKSYYARLTQSGVVDPNPVTVLLNQSGWTVTVTRSAVGTYLVTVSGHLATFNSSWYALTDNRFALQTNQNYMLINQTGSTELTIYTYKAGVLSDGLLSETPLEIKFF